MDNIEQADDKISTALMQLMRTSQNAFVISMLLNMPRTSAQVKAIELAGTTIKYNPDYVNNLDTNDLKFNLMHLSWHLPFFDELRAKDKDDKQLWNDACDVYINHMIKADTTCGVEVPHSAKCDAKYRGKEKEEIYQLLLLEAKQNNQNQPNNDPMSGDISGDSGDSEMSEEQEQKLEQEISSMVQQAAIQAQGCGGHVPNQITQMLEDLYNPKLPWDVLLAKYMDSFLKEDFTYQRINKHLFPHDLIMPTLYSEGLGNVFIANDESGSVSDKEYEAYLGAIKDIKDRLNPSRIDVLNFTTHITSTHVIDQDEDIAKIQFRGTGGTYIPCVFEHIANNGLKPQVLIIFSDMDSSMPQSKPPYDVIWISVNNKRFKPPFGKAIHVEIK